MKRGTLSRLLLRGPRGRRKGQAPGKAPSDSLDLELPRSWDNAPQPTVAAPSQAWGARIALTTVIVVGAIWLWARTPSVESAASADYAGGGLLGPVSPSLSPNHAEESEAAGAGLRNSTIAQAPPAVVQWGTPLPQDGPVPTLDAGRGTIRWPTGKDGNDGYRETPVHRPGRADPDSAMFAADDERFSLHAARKTCRGRLPEELVTLSLLVGRNETLALAALEGLVEWQAALVRERAEAREAQRLASWLQTEAETACEGDRLGALSMIAQVDTGAAGRQSALDEAVAILRSMKPKAAAKVVESWDRSFAAKALGRLTPRVAGPILAAMGADRAAAVAETMLAELAFGGGRP